MKRFYKNATVREGAQGFQILLDDRPVRTPARLPLVIPAARLAAAVADEWAAQETTVDPEAMPLTKLATSVTDLMPARREDAISEVRGYGQTDLLCYRAAEPADLVLRQARLWQPWLDWADQEFAARLTVTDALMPVQQDLEALRKLGALISGLSDWRLIGLHSAVRLTGSLVLGLAIERQVLDTRQAFDLALLEELYEIERWGVETEQMRRHERLKRDLAATQRYLELVD